MQIDVAGLNQTFALISIAGFAVQRSLELLDPLFVVGLIQIKNARETKDLPFGLNDKDVKTWAMGFIAFLIGLFLALNTKMELLTVLNDKWFGWVDKLVIALAISTGTNALNSVLKFGEHAKEARKKETLPLPTVTITPSTATVTIDSQIQLIATVTGTDDTRVTWKVLETNGGTIDSTGIYTAPALIGTYHVAAISVANELAVGSATITVTKVGS